MGLKQLRIFSSNHLFRCGGRDDISVDTVSLQDVTTRPEDGITTWLPDTERTEVNSVDRTET